MVNHMLQGWPIGPTNRGDHRDNAEPGPEGPPFALQTLTGCVDGGFGRLARTRFDSIRILSTVSDVALSAFAIHALYNPIGKASIRRVSGQFATPALLKDLKNWTSLDEFTTERSARTPSSSFVRIHKLLTPRTPCAPSLWPRSVPRSLQCTAYASWAVMVRSWRSLNYQRNLLLSRKTVGRKNSLAPTQVYLRCEKTSLGLPPLQYGLF